MLFANDAPDFLAVRLAADQGYQVGQLGFDLAGWPNADFLIEDVSVKAGAAVLFSQTDVLIEGDFRGPRRSALAFADGLFADELLLRIEFSNLAGAQRDNIGLDNLRFAQNPPWTPGLGDFHLAPGVPEPGTLSLFGAALVGARLARLRAARVHPVTATLTTAPSMPGDTRTAG